MATAVRESRRALSMNRDATISSVGENKTLMDWAYIRAISPDGRAMLWVLRHEYYLPMPDGVRLTGGRGMMGEGEMSISSSNK